VVVQYHQNQLNYRHNSHLDGTEECEVKGEREDSGALRDQQTELEEDHEELTEGEECEVGDEGQQKKVLTVHQQKYYQKE